MAIVYRGVDLTDGSPVALKEMHGAHAAELLPRFLREAKLLRELKDPGVVQYRGHGLGKDGDWFLAMEWVEGGDLGARQRAAPLSVPESLALDRVIPDYQGLPRVLAAARTPRAG